MKFSENWLRPCLTPPLSPRELADALTMGGIEVELIEPAAPPFDRVVVGEVLEVEKHPDADRLTVCKVNAGVAPLTVVCGAPNVRLGIKVPTALGGARLPGIEIRPVKVRGVESQGMLCSAKELGLSENADGLMVLAAEATVGVNLRELLDLDDKLLTTKPTPNRGDCLSVLGVAREVTAVTGAKLTPVSIKPAAISTKDKVAVTLEAREACTRYYGQLVRGDN